MDRTELLSKIELRILLLGLRFLTEKRSSTNINDIIKNNLLLSKSGIIKSTQGNEGTNNKEEKDNHSIKENEYQDYLSYFTRVLDSWRHPKDRC
jgi:hypothetical protein